MTRAEMTMGEAAAWRAGAEAMRESLAQQQDRQAAEAQQIADRRLSDADAAVWQDCADHHHDLAAAIRATPLPEPPR